MVFWAINYSSVISEILVVCLKSTLLANDHGSVDENVGNERITFPLYHFSYYLNCYLIIVECALVAEWIMGQTSDSR